MPKLIILVGLPGSGKTTYAEKFSGRYVVLNQDSISGGRKVLLERTKKLLKRGRSVVIDRCNINSEQRKPFIDLAKSLKVRVEARVLVISPKVCKQRISKRTDHPTVNPKMTWVVDRFMDMNQKDETRYPTMNEGIAYIRKLYFCERHKNYHRTPNCE